MPLKIPALLLIAAFSVGASFSNRAFADLEPAGPTDGELAARLIGSWVSIPSERIPVVPGAITEFAEDQRVRYTQYQTPECERVWFTIEGRWWIRAGRVYLEVEKSDLPAMHPAGSIISDEILVLNDSHMRVRDESGRVIRRERASRCQSTTPRLPVPPSSRPRLNLV